jgi:hypothetical protein
LGFQCDSVGWVGVVTRSVVDWQLKFLRVVINHVKFPLNYHLKLPPLEDGGARERWKSDWMG